MERVETGSGSVNPDQIPSGLGWANPALYGTIGEGSDQTAINAAIVAISALGGGTVYLPDPIYTLTGSITLLDNVTIRGAGKRRTVVQATTGVSTAVFLASSGATVANAEICHLTIDGGWAEDALAIHGVQITNGSNPNVHDCRLTNLGRGGIVFQGFGAGLGTLNGIATDNELDGIGLEDGSTGFGIWFKDASSDGIAARNTLTNIMGGMGIGGSGSTDWPFRTRVVENNIQMAPSTTGFEAIGFTHECWYTVIANNVIEDSQDNGISASCGYSSVTGNTINNTQNHGIYTEGPFTVISGNFIRNVGQDGLASTYGGVAINGNALGTRGHHCQAIGNIVVDDQAVSTTGYIVKIHTSNGNNSVAFNVGSGFSQASAYGDNYDTTDILVDMNEHTTSISLERIFLASIGPFESNGLISLSGETQTTGRHYFGPTFNASSGQANFQTNLISRPQRIAKQSVITGVDQTADFDQWHDKDANVLARVTIAGQARFQSLGVSNSAAATTLGTVTDKIEIFDAAGASLGFLPVYDAIT